MLSEDEIAAEIRAAVESGVVSVQPADWPNEQRRQDAAAEGDAEAEAWAAIEARMDVIGSNGNGGEHYSIVGCTQCFGRGVVSGVYTATLCPACHGVSAMERRL